MKHEYNYSQDKLEGDSKIYYEDGSIYTIEKYKNNKLDGDTKVYSFNNSNIPMYVYTYKNGKKVFERAYSAKGELLYKKKY